ncbi:hypothetical protein LWM68_41865 [Niabella sp. W65]|nr:hypothetical protein [Niabella sp. W65]MCH7368706.1 hypothetical protein [Niabella sp. W65]
MRKFTLAFLLAALAFTKTHAAKIQGFIKEEHGSPLAYATVTVKEHHRAPPPTARAFML